MSSYPPNNLCVYIYAQAGCMGALIAARNQPTDPNEADYADAAERADFFAQEIDTIWGVGSYTNADLQQIQSAAASLWAGGRSPVPGAAGLTAAGYTGIAQALIAGVKAGTAQIVVEGINPNGCGGGGGGTVTSVTGSAPIVITGSAASPNVTITAATDGAAGSMSAADKTKLDALVPPNLVTMYETHTTNIQGGAGAQPKVGIVQLVAHGSGIFRWAVKGQVAGAGVAGVAFTWQVLWDTGSGAVAYSAGAKDAATVVGALGQYPVDGSAVINNAANNTDITISTGGSGGVMNALTPAVPETLPTGTIGTTFEASGIMNIGESWGANPVPNGHNVFLALQMIAPGGFVCNMTLSLEEIQAT